MEDLSGRVDALEIEVDMIKKSFPVTDDGEVDYRGHKMYHEALIEANREQAIFWRQLRRDLVVKGTWFGLIIIAGLVANGILWKLGIGK